MSIYRYTLNLTAGAAFLAGSTLASAVLAQQPQHIRGTIVGVKDSVLSIKTAAGTAKELKLGEKTGVFLVSKTDLGALTKDKFVGITSVEKGGVRVAREVHVFDEKLRGLGEGHYPWDLDSTPNMMTNANIAKIDSVASDRVLKLNYKGGEQSISVPESVPIVAFTATTPDQLKSGRKTFIIAKDGAAVAVVVGADGLTPPM